MKLADVLFGNVASPWISWIPWLSFLLYKRHRQQCCFSMGANFLPHIPSIVSVPTGPGALSALLGKPLRGPEGPKGFEECLG